MSNTTTSGGYEVIGPRTPGAKRAEPGEHVFDFHAVNQIMGGPGYSPVFGGCVEGDRMIVALMRAPAGKMGDPHLHPNEQWIYILEGKFDFRTDGKTFIVGPGGLIYIPAAQVHQGGATADADCVFFTCKDATHSLHGMRADSVDARKQASASA
jgi:quercetin dioxygenase-like cupin family protein